MDKVKVELGATEETLFIPLLMRKEDAHATRSILHDHMAKYIADQIDFDWEKYGGWNKMSYYGCLVRAKYCDQEAVAVAQKFGPNDLLLVNAGCGLDTRWHRTGRQLSGYRRMDMDLDPVMRIRQQVVPRLEGVSEMSADLTRDEWIEQLQKETSPNTHICLVIEGVMMYFTEDEVRGLFQSLHQAFGGRVTIICDLLNKFMVRKQRSHDTLRHSQAVFRSGFDGVEEVEALHPNLRVEQRASIFEMMRPYSLIARLFHAVPSLKWNNTIYTLSL